VYAEGSFFHAFGMSRWSRLAPFPTLEAARIREGGVEVPGSGEPPLRSNRLLVEYRDETERLLERLRNADTIRVARIGGAGLPLLGTTALDPEGFAESVRAGGRGESSKERFELDERIKLYTGFDEAGPPGNVPGVTYSRVRSALEVTLALRNRIFRGAKSAEEAVWEARLLLESRLASFFRPKRGGNLKFENRESDI